MFREERFLAEFAVDHVTEPYDFTFRVVDRPEAPVGECVADLPALRVYRDDCGTTRYLGAAREGWESCNTRVRQVGKSYDVQLKQSVYPDRIGVKTVLNAIQAEHLAAQNGGFIFHSAFIEVKGKAVLFTAPSGTGKSTQADLWNRLRGAEIINGDRSAVRFVDGCATAEGIPFAGSSQFCKNAVLPLAAIVYLSQAPATTIRPLRGYAAFRAIWEGVSVNTWDREDMALVTDCVQKIAAHVPVYHLACTPDESAVEALENALKGR